MFLTRRWFRGVICVGFVIVLGLTGNVLAEGTEMTGIVCDHEWVRYYGSETIAANIEQCNETFHWKVRHVAEEVCKHCGEYGEILRATKSSQPHAYELADWSGTEENISMRLQCHLCGFQKLIEIEYTAILNAEATPCLNGEPCVIGNRGYLNTQGKIVPWTDSVEEQVHLTALIYYAEEKLFRPAGRYYCYVCGRPDYDESVRPESAFKENWNGFPIMTEEYFLTVDMPENLPYQLIDQLREEAQAS